MTTERLPIFRPIVFAGLTAGVLDITAAGTQTLLRGGSLARLGQVIASGWLGAVAYDSGTPAVILGYVSHFIVATGWATLFVLAARQIPALLTKPFLVGPLYGIFVWSMMRWVVLPLSAYPHKAGVDPKNIAIGLAIHMTCVGLAIVLPARSALGKH